MYIRVLKTVTLKINGFIFGLSLLVFAILIKLGFWQLERAQEKEQRLQQMEYYRQQAALELKDVLLLMSQAGGLPSAQAELRSEQMNDLPVRLSGEFSKQVFLLDNQVYKGRPGYQVIRVFRDLRSNRQVLVNLGWVPGTHDRAILPTIEPIQGRVEFRGKTRIVEPPIVLADEALQKDKWPQRIQAIYVDKISSALDIPLLPFLVYVDNDSPLGYVKEWVPIVMPPEKHRAYAFQWFTLALAWVMLMLAAAYKAARPNRS